MKYIELLNQQDAERVSPLKVMRSNAGWYIGTSFFDGTMHMPNSRDSGYFATREETEEVLKEWNE